MKAIASVYSVYTASGRQFTVGDRVSVAKNSAISYMVTKIIIAYPEAMVYLSKEDDELSLRDLVWTLTDIVGVCDIQK